MNTVQNGKGSKDRVTNTSEFRKNFEAINFSKSQILKNEKPRPRPARILKNI